MLKLKIKDGKLYGSNYSFALPEGFNFVVESDCMSENKLEFVSDDGITRIKIFFETLGRSAKKDIQDIIDGCNYIKTGDFVSVKRGAGTGIGLLYKSDCINEEYYEERYDFKKNEYNINQLIIEVYIDSGREKLKQTIREVLELPTVKAFLESIEYY